MTHSLDRRDAALLGLLLAIALLRGLLWIASYPALKITDETSHFDNIQFRAEHQLRRAVRIPGVAIDKVMPRTASTELKRAWTATNFYWRDSFLVAKRRVPEEKELEERALHPEDAATTGQNTAIGYPGLYYGLATIPYKIFRKTSVLTRLFAVRVYSLLWGLLLVVCTYVVVRWAVGHRALAFVAGLFATLQPMAAQQTIAINNDAGLIGLCALAFLLQLDLLRRPAAPPSWWRWTLQGALLALAIQMKPQALGLVPGALILAGLAIHAAPRARRTWIALGLAVLGYVVVRAAGLGQEGAIEEKAAGGGVAPALLDTGVPSLPLPAASGFLSFVHELPESFGYYLFTTGWGAFCWLDAYLDTRWFIDLSLAAPLLWLGLAAAATHRLLLPAARRFWDDRLAAFSAFTVVTGFTVVFFAEYYARTRMNLDHAIQGRAFLYVLPPAAVLGTIALGSLVPARFRTLAAALAALSLVLLASGALFTVVSYQYVK